MCSDHRPAQKAARGPAHSSYHGANHGSARGPAHRAAQGPALGPYRSPNRGPARGTTHQGLQGPPELVEVCSFEPFWFLWRYASQGIVVGSDVIASVLLYPGSE